MNAFDPEAAARRFLPPAEPTPLVSPYEPGERIRYMAMEGTPYWVLATVLSSKPIKEKSAFFGRCALQNRETEFEQK